MMKQVHTRCALNLAPPYLCSKFVRNSNSPQFPPNTNYYKSRWFWSGTVPPLVITPRAVSMPLYI